MNEKVLSSKEMYIKSGQFSHSAVVFVCCIRHPRCTEGMLKRNAYLVHSVLSQRCLFCVLHACTGPVHSRHRYNFRVRKKTIDQVAFEKAQERILENKRQAAAKEKEQTEKDRLLVRCTIIDSAPTPNWDCMWRGREGGIRAVI